MAPKNDPNFDPPKINLKCSVRWNYVAVMNVASLNSLITLPILQLSEI